jgi:molybdenum cofactor cytidylyltransferase
MDRRDTLPVLDPAELPGPADRPDAAVHAVVLAAGTSSRFGANNKLLEAVDGEPIVVQSTRALLAADLAAVTVVVGHEADRVRAALADLDVDVRHNRAFADGQSTSVATGVAAARDAGADAVVLALGDMPDVSFDAVDALVDAYRKGAGSALAVACEGHRGNPVLFDGEYFDGLADVDGDVGGREILLGEDDAAAVETGDPGVLYDVDRPEDL